MNTNGSTIEEQPEDPSGAEPKPRTCHLYNACPFFVGPSARSTLPLWREYAERWSAWADSCRRVHNRCHTTAFPMLDHLKILGTCKEWFLWFYPDGRIGISSLRCQPPPLDRREAAEVPS